jgi:translation initiation factor 2 subunit 2
MEFKYGDLLERAFEQLPEVSEEEVRFEIPTVRGNIQGNKTVLTNLQQIASHFRREFDHLLKFLLRELATTAEVKKGEVVFIGRFRSEFLNKKIEKYFKEFVACYQCKKPDTNLVKEHGVTYLVCEACGARSTVRTLK